MAKKIKLHPNGKKRKEVLPMEKNGYPFKLIINYDLEGNIQSVMEKPNNKGIGKGITCSGAHMCAITKENHYDFYQDGKKIKKEYDHTDFPFLISGSAVVLK